MLSVKPKNIIANAPQRGGDRYHQAVTVNIFRPAGCQTRRQAFPSPVPPEKIQDECSAINRRECRIKCLRKGEKHRGDIYQISSEKLLSAKRVVTAFDMLRKPGRSAFSGAGDGTN